MKTVNNKVVSIFAVMTVIAAFIAFAVLNYWYSSILELHKNHMQEMVRSNKANIKTLYFHAAEYHKESLYEAFASTIDLVGRNFMETYKKPSGNSFHLIVREGGSFYALLDAVNGVTEVKKRKLEGIGSDHPVYRAFVGDRGVTEAVYDSSAEKSIVAFDYLDMHSVRLILICRAFYGEVAKPNAILAVSIAVFLLVVLTLGGAVYYFLVNRNIKNLKEAYEELEAYGHIMDCSQEYLAYIDNTGNYVAVNNAFEHIFGLTKDEIVGRNIRELSRESTYVNWFKDMFEKCAAGYPQRKQEWVKSNYQEDIFIDVRLVPHFVQGKVTGVVGTATDITELEYIKQEFVRKNDKLKALTEELEAKVELETSKRLHHEQLVFEQKKFADMGQMINAIAHQWRQPINAIGLYIQYIYESLAGNLGSDAELREFKDDSIELVQYMSKTIDDFRSFFNPRDDETNFEVIKAVIATVSLVEAQLVSNNIEFIVSCKCEHREFLRCNDLKHPPCEHPMTLVEGYPSEFKQVLMNLIQNAKDVLVEKQSNRLLEVRVTAGKDTVTVDVLDNGEGIPEDVMPNIFDPYFTTKDEGKGTGIGLYMSKLIIEDHMKGHLTASNIDQGAVFTVKLDKIDRQCSV